MAKPRYEFADILVFDPVAAHRNATRMALFSLGFRKVAACDTIEDLDRAIKHVPPDIIVCEAQGVEDALCDLIATVRHGTGGHANPFIIIIVTAWEKSHALVGRVVNSGADDLVLRPFSTKILKSRIDVHAERRKGFVVTHDYVGPDRRKDSNRPSNIELFQPPNSLKMKALDGLTMPEANFRLQQELRRAKETLAGEKLAREVFRICVLWRILQDLGDEDPDVLIQELRDLALSVAKRCRAGEMEEALGWCDSILAAVEGLHHGVDRNASLHLLGQGALNLNQTVAPDRTKADHMRLVEETVATIRARAEEQAAQQAEEAAKLDQAAL